jgi:hypothetical protein
LEPLLLVDDATGAITPVAAQMGRSGRRRDWWVYPIFSLAVLAWAVLVTARHSWAADFRLHLSTVHGLMRNAWNPVDPLVGAVHGSPYYSPYMALLAGITKLGPAPQAVLEIGGLVSLALWLWAVRRFCRRLSPGPMVPVLVVVFSTALWGAQDTVWSGFFGLHSLSWNLGYPSTIAAALMFLVWDVFFAYRERAEGWRDPLALVVLLALVLLIHPFTAVNTLIGVAAFALANPRALLDARSVKLIAAGGAAVLLALAWPLSNLFDLFSAPKDFDAIHKPLLVGFFHTNGLTHYGLALIGLPALFLARRQPLVRELTVLFLVAVVIVAVAQQTHHYSLGRVLPVVVLPLHVALAACLAHRADLRRPVRGGYVLITAAACLVGLYANLAGLVRADPWTSNKELVRHWGAAASGSPYDDLLASIKPGQVLMMDYGKAGRSANARGAYSVAPGWPYPFVDEIRRHQDTAAFFSAATSPAKRLALADKYHVDCVTASASRQLLLAPGALPGFTQIAQVGQGKIILLCRG